MGNTVYSVAVFSDADDASNKQLESLLENGCLPITYDDNTYSLKLASNPADAKIALLFVDYCTPLTELVDKLKKLQQTAMKACFNDDETPVLCRFVINVGDKLVEGVEKYLEAECYVLNISNTNEQQHLLQHLVEDVVTANKTSDKQVEQRFNTQGGGAACSQPTNPDDGYSSNDDEVDDTQKVPVRSIPKSASASRYDHLFKVVLVGDAKVGKSVLLRHFTDGSFTPEYYCTTGVEFAARTLKVDNKVVKLQLWDTAGQESFRSITRAFYKGAAIIMLCCDITRRKTFDNLLQRLQEVQQLNSNKHIVCLVACKSDLSDQRNVSIEELQGFAETHGLIYKECSAKTAIGVDEAFGAAASQAFADVEITHATSNPHSTDGGRSAGSATPEYTFENFKSLYQSNRGATRFKSPGFWGMAGRLNHPKFYKRLGLGISNMNDVETYVKNNVNIRNARGDMNSLRSAKILFDTWGKTVEKKQNDDSGNTRYAAGPLLQL